MLARRGLALGLSLGAVAAAGCGSSSSSSTGSSTPAPSATAASTTSTVYNPNHVPKSAVIASSAYFNALVQGLSTRLSSSNATAAAHCIQSGLEAAGFKTQGDSEGANVNKAASIVIPCIQKAQGQ